MSEARNHKAEVEAVARALDHWVLGGEDLNRRAAEDAIAALDALRPSPQGEDHETGIEAAADPIEESYGYGGPDDLRAQRRAKAVEVAERAIAAYLSRCPSPDPAAWLRSDEAERVRIEAERDEIPPEDALAHAWEQLHGCPSPERNTEKEN